MTDETKELRFSFATLQREIESVSKLAHRYLTRDGVHRLTKAKQQLDLFKSKPAQMVVWEVPESEPIRTKLSVAEYEQRGGGKGKGPHIHGALSFKWQMTTSEKAVKDMLLCGKASTIIRLCEGEGDEAPIISVWKMEIGVGAAESPGCFFHVQVPSVDGDTQPAVSVPVPRLPIFPPTPMACLEFALGELFQMGWVKHVDRAGTPLSVWRGIQQAHLSRHFTWQLEQITKTEGSPLMHLKGFPGRDLLMSAGS
jgi:hypothetical protein